MYDTCYEIRARATNNEWLQTDRQLGRQTRIPKCGRLIPNSPGYGMKDKYYYIYTETSTMDTDDDTGI
jgi:hypothetical protein